MPISIYTSAFNIQKCKFNFSFFLKKALSIGDEIVISVNKSEDNTLEILKSFEDQFSNELKIIETDYSYNDPLLDGKCKNNALQHTKFDCKLQLDLDEYIPHRFKPYLLDLYDQFLKDKYDAVMLPVIDLYKDKKICRSVGQKWYLHKPGFFRGPVNFGKLNNGHVDVNKSDTCELIDKEGNLVQSFMVLNPQDSIDTKLEILRNHHYIPFIVHTGYLDLQNRIHRNKEFWATHWSIEAGKHIQIPTNISEIDNYPTIEHNLNISWN